ncbi:hypothetical protein QM787_03330 [Rhodococcus ruber]|uniref:DUF6542 domain-containing protein n=1 Tax=Rhodococcus ruber TaxID=1830 RepID=A0A098BWN1_9NOCA|nr:DUF6542 domain-containing protein [Rhodococcus ruber]RIK11494.1 MAG: hypothetical protein DCC47_10695 [Acidobacteriota bacterium]MCD2126918.1 hypothetical protein [Rhodococcus ruber]MCZ4503797.1 hypothetical protein [Rhodococcus ruber]MCZ4529576.1 hypothetical protein [Rhodococcus ruber]MCZ4619340.1 hypothetical protein [Rhodococcus ruber]
MPLDMRSVAPTVPGVPWWGAVLVAAGSTLLGFLIDAARGNELGSAFSAFYVLGCVAAVAAVQHRALFTAMAQPPLLLLVAVPIAQEFLVESGGGGLKDLALNVAYPLVNRFPVMLTATVAVLVVGGLRIFLSRSQVPAPARPPRRGARAAGAPSRDSQLDRDGGGAAKPARGRRARAAARPPASTKASVRQVADTRDNPVVRRRTTAPAPDAARRGAGEPPAAPDVAYRTRRAEPAPRRAEPAPRRAEPAPRRAEPAPRRAAETRRDYDRRGDHRSRPDRPYERGEVPPPSRRRAPGPETPDYRQPRVRYRDRYED